MIGNRFTRCRTGVVAAGTVLLCSLSLTGLGGGQASAQAPARKKAIIIGLDGVRWDALRTADTPVIDGLIAAGTWTDYAHTGEITVSGPSWSSILTGVWMDKHRVRDNSFAGHDYARHPNLLSLVERVRPELVTASFVDWLPIDDHTIAVEPLPDIRVTADYEKDGDVKMVAEAARILAQDDPDLMFFYFADPDIAGHDYGFHPSSPGYRAELEQVDRQIGQLLEAIRSRPAYDREDWLILFTTDHGGTLDGAHGRNTPEHRQIFFIASGPSAGRGEMRSTVNQVDVAPTALAHLGIPIDPEWDLDGHPVGLRSRLEYGANLVFNGDAEYGSAADSVQVNRGIAGWTDLGGMTVLSYGAAGGYPTESDPGPADRGANLFVGGPERIARITQRIDLSEIVGDVVRGRVRYELSGYLGGYAGQRDLATVTVRFVDFRGGLLALDQIGPVTVADRLAAWGPEHTTGLLLRRATGGVPRETRMIEIELKAEAGSGTNDGYADNISLVLNRR